MSNQFTESWENIKKIGLDILQSTMNQSWDQTLELATKRHALLLAHFKQYPINKESNVHYRFIIEEIIRSESKIQAIVHEAKARLSAESTKLRNQKYGINAYQASGM